MGAAHGRCLAAACAVVVGALGCRGKSSPSGLYCEGGVVDGRSGGGECMEISRAVPDADPESVGSAVWVRGYAGERYDVRRVGKGKYQLYLGGKLAGSVDQDGDWITVTFASGPRPYRLRSDRPGPLI